MRRTPMLVLAGCVAMSMSLSGCGVVNNEFTKPLNDNETAYAFTQGETYQNNLELDGQWKSNKYTGDGEYGIGDPFVMRFDGKYYLYPSSSEKSNDEQGVKVFQSDNMIDWTYEGFAATGDEVEKAFAPEVVYYNGSFYMTESQAGTGHYILKSDSPTGPFKVITDNFGRNIDGSFWVSDEGKLLFIYPANNVIDIAEVDTTTMLPGIETSLSATLNGWTEGPGMFRRGSNLFLTYTGNSVISDGYRVGYSYQLGNDPLGQFVMPSNNIVLLHTGTENFKGLGHSSNVIGPNLDSWYTAYHNLISTAGPQRRLMIDQYCTNGGVLLANGPTFSPVASPERPDFEARLSSSNDGFTSQTLNEEPALISQSDAEQVFTAEYNFSTKDASAVINFLCGYVSEQNYHSIRLDMSAGTLSLVATVDGKETILQTSDIDVPALGCIHTVRVENGSNTTNVSFDSMQKITASDARITAGKIGYSSQAEVAYSYTAFSNNAFGTSDFEAIKNLPSSFAAVHYLKGENRGFSIANASVKSDGVRQGEKENTNYNEADGSYSLVLDKTNDWVKYAVNATETSFYGLSAYITPHSVGSQFQVVVDSNDIYTFTVPESGNSTEEYVNLLLGQFKLEAGNHTLKIRLVSGFMDIKQFEMVLTNPTTLDYENAMDEINEQGWSYTGNWKIIDGAHTVKSGDTAYAFTGTEKLTDFAVEVSVALGEEDSVYDGGILLRCKNESVMSGESYYLQGYYLAIRSDQIVLNKYNYDSKALDLVNVSFSKDEYHRIRAELINNCIKIYVDDMETPAITYYDDSAFLSGQIALCSNKVGMSFKDVIIETY